MAIGKEFYSLIRSYGGLALQYTSIGEALFSSSPGSPYTPPERGNRRRINGSRTVQLLSECPGVVETFQASAGVVRLPANTTTASTNDAGDGRLFFLKNSGTDFITIQDYTGTPLYSLAQGSIVAILGNTANAWDFLLDPANIVGETFELCFVRNGGVSNSWLGLGSTQIPSNITPQIIKYDCKLKALTFANAVNNATVDLEVYKNGLLTYTWSVVGRRIAFKTTVDLALSAGDRVGVFARGVGGGGAIPENVVVTLGFMVTTNTTGENGTGTF